VYFEGWLDDIGLPQYKDQFIEARIDGRMLHCLTIVCISILPTCRHCYWLVFSASLSSLNTHGTERSPRLSVSQSVCQKVGRSQSALWQTAEQIRMPFGVVSRFG